MRYILPTLAIALAAAAFVFADAAPPAHLPAGLAVPDKLVVLTFDDSVADQAAFVAPMLKKLHFGATFFITEGFTFATDKQHYMTWQQIRQLNADGFEIANHTRHHTAVTSQSPDQLNADVAYIEQQCEANHIPRPVTFAYPGYAVNDAAVKVLDQRGYRLARIGGSRAFDPKHDDPMRVPTAFDSKPPTTYDDFVHAVQKARDGKVAVLLFHGVPDTEHPWVNTAPDAFTKYMTYLKDHHYRVIPFRDLIRYLPKK